MVRRGVEALRRSLNMAYPELNETVYAQMPKTDELIAACASLPMMDEFRLVVVTECSLLGGKGGAEEAKKVAAYLDRLPDTTVLVLCSEALPDKRRALYKRVRELGQVSEFAAPKREECIRFSMDQAKSHGADLPKKAAETLVDIVGCDYYALDSETQKLAIYSEGKGITQNDVKACAARSLEYNVFEIHGLFVHKKSREARALLADVMESERPEMLIGLFARKLRDLYKVRAMLDAGYRSSSIASTLKMKPFIADIHVRECRRFSAQALRSALVLLADLDYAMKTGEADASLALPQALVKIYEL
jgi:DNA polymerase-3 subunit delta